MSYNLKFLEIIPFILCNLNLSDEMLGGSDDEFLVDEFSDDDYQNLKPEEKEKILEYLC